MTEDESEVELGAAKEETITKAAPKGLQFPTSPLQHPARPPTAPAALLEVHFTYLLDINFTSSVL